MNKDQTQTQKRSTQSVEVRTGNLGGIQKHCPNIQEQSWESYNPDGIESDQGCQRQEVCKYIGDKRKTREKCGLIAE